MHVINPEWAVVQGCAKYRMIAANPNSDGTYELGDGKILKYSYLDEFIIEYGSENTCKAYQGLCFQAIASNRGRTALEKYLDCVILSFSALGDLDDQELLQFKQLSTFQRQAWRASMLQCSTSQNILR